MNRPVSEETRKLLERAHKAIEHSIALREQRRALSRHSPRRAPEGAAGSPTSVYRRIAAFRLCRCGWPT